ncbi:MAG TPA: ABC transporter ATP-binding protein [Thermoplasmata archaeon]|nr:ABC transporter ATP-binding protein [Thermoplasmata archaeon]
MDILVAKGVKKHFGGIRAVDGVDLVVKDKSITALIGPNGSGKTTFFNVISGFYPADAGIVNFRDHRVIDIKDETSTAVVESTPPPPPDLEIVPSSGRHNLSPHEISRLGMVRTFQIVKLFRNLSVIENMLAAPSRQHGNNLLECVITYSKAMREEREMYDKALQLLEMLQIFHLRDEFAGNLSGGQMKLLTLGMVLMRDPEMLLLDEPVAGVNPTLANKIFDIIISLRDRLGKTFLIVEHNMDVVLGFSETIYVMNRGRILAQGHPEEIMANRQVIDAYLGGH